MSVSVDLAIVSSDFMSWELQKTEREKPHSGETISCHGFSPYLWHHKFDLTHAHTAMVAMEYVPQACSLLCVWRAWRIGTSTGFHPRNYGVFAKLC